MHKNVVRRYIYTSSLWLLPYIIFYFIYVIMAVAFSQLLGIALDVAGGSVSDFYSFAIEMLLVTLSLLLTFLLYAFSKLKLKKKIYKNLRCKLYQNLYNKSLAEYIQDGKDAYASVLINDTKLLEDEYIGGYTEVIEDLTMLVVAIVSLVRINFICSIIVILSCLIPFVIPVLFMGKLQEKMNRFSEENERFLKSISIDMEGFETYKNYNAVHRIKKRFNRYNGNLGKAKREAYTYQDMLMSALNLASMMMMILILICGMFMALKGILTVGEVFAITFVSGCVIAPIGNISQHLPKILGAKKIVEKYNKLFEDSIHASNNVDLINEICVENVSLQMQERRILDNISLRLEKNKKYTFVGGSGSGKSTCLKLLLGYYQNYDGQILYDSEELKVIDTGSLFKNITYLSQSPVIFQGTFRENITLFDNQISEDRLNVVLQMSELSQLVESLPNGVDTVIEEQGKNLSGGEKQRIAIARSLLKDTKILVLDEATSALDFDNYMKIEKMLLRIPDITLITVTHRLEEKLLNHYDEIFVMSQGKLSEQGTLTELLKLNGYFTKLFNSQRIETIDQKNVKDEKEWAYELS